MRIVRAFKIIPDTVVAGEITVVKLDNISIGLGGFCKNIVIRAELVVAVESFFQDSVGGGDPGV